MPKFPMHDSARPARLEAGMIDALRARRLPGRWLYEGEAQAERWLDYHRAWSPSANHGAMGRVYDQAFAGAVQAMRGGSGLHVVSLGCGGGRKDAGLLRAARGHVDSDAAEALAYFPLDASVAMVAEAAAHVADVLPGLPIHALVADLWAWPRLEGWLEQSLAGARSFKNSGFQPRGPGARRLFSCIGMVPNFDPTALSGYVRSLLKPGDGLLISANLSPQGMEADKAGILAQYDNPPARRWYAGALENLGLGEHEVEPAVSARPLAADGSAWQVVVEAELPRAVAIRLGESEVTYAQGERLEVFRSNRLTREAFETVLESADLHARGAWLHPNKEEGVFFCPA